MIFSRRRDDIVEIVIDNPPVNAIGSFLRMSLSAGVALAQKEATIAAIVITGGGKIFSAGADVAEFKGGELPAEDAPEVIDEIEANGKPIVAAISGLCLGGGLELALACHHRVATSTASFAFPEVKLGLLPGAGGTQRLPRLIGTAPALDMIVKGDPIDAETALAAGLVDALCPVDLLVDRAVLLARETVGVEPRRTGDRRAIAEDGLFERYLAAHGAELAGLDAPRACIEAIRLATQTPLRDGLASEAALFNKLLRSEQSQALRHIFFAERAAGKPPAKPRQDRAREIDSVGILTDGSAAVAPIAAAFLSAGTPVLLFAGAGGDPCQIATAIRLHLEAEAENGRHPPASLSHAMSLLMSPHDERGLATCGMVIEATADRRSEREGMRLIADIAHDDAVLAVASSGGGCLDDLASETARPQDVVGLTFAPHRWGGGLVEIARGTATSLSTISSAISVMRRLGMASVVTADRPGGIGERLQAVFRAQASAALRDGATLAAIDHLRAQFGMPDIGREERTIRSIGKAPPAISDDELRVRLLFATMNEAAAILEESVAQRASDIDVVQVRGYGWLRHKGGSMFWADRIGISKVVNGLQRYRQTLGPDFRISPYLVRKAEAGSSLLGN